MRSLLLSIAISFVTAASLWCAPFDPNDILISFRRTLLEYTPAGVLVQSIPFSYGNRPYPSTEDLRDISVDQYGLLDSYNGTFNPFLTRYDPVTGTFSHKAFAGWNTVASTTYGGLATYRNFVYASDMGTFGGSGANGIVRFDIFANTAVRFASGLDFLDLNIGLDGKLYAGVRGPSTGLVNPIRVYDPISLQQIGSVTVQSNITQSDNIRGMAVDQAGRIFLVGLGGTVYRLSSSGVLEASVNTTFSNLGDIDVDESGRLIIGQEGGHVIVGDSTLTSALTSFTVADDATNEELFVSFAHPVPIPIGPVPTPTPTPAPTPTPNPTHNILVSLGSGINSVREFTPDGLLIRTIPFTYNNTSYPITEQLRDIVVDQNGTINAYNGTFAPFLTRYSPVSGAFTYSTFSGWSTVNDVSYGGIAAYQNFVYATDMITGNDSSSAKGIVRFDFGAGSAARFATNAEFRELNMGLDGKLYALPEIGGINVYDPITMQLLRQVAFPAEIAGDGFKGVAADQAGRIFLSSSFGAVYRLSSSGALEASLATGFPSLLDIDIDETGRILLAQQEDSWIIVTDTTLNDFSTFRAISSANSQNGCTFATFGPLVPPVHPEGLAIKSIKRLTNGHMQLQCTGVPNQVNTIEAAHDLTTADFVSIGSITADGAGVFSFEDMDVAEMDARFYRLILTLP